MTGKVLVRRLNRVPAKVTPSHGTQGFAGNGASLLSCAHPQNRKGEEMFLHRVKMNWKKHQTLTVTILLVALAQIVLGNVFGDGLFSGYSTLKIGVVVLAATVAWAFLKTSWELGTVYYKRLCTFVSALRRFCREYWSKTAAV
jgi:hypothetical protein